MRLLNYNAVTAMAGTTSCAWQVTGAKKGQDEFCIKSCCLDHYLTDTDGSTRVPCLGVYKSKKVLYCIYILKK